MENILHPNCWFLEDKDHVLCYFLSPEPSTDLHTVMLKNHLPKWGMDGWMDKEMLIPMLKYKNYP